MPENLASFGIVKGENLQGDVGKYTCPEIGHIAVGPDRNSGLGQAWRNRMGDIVSRDAFLIFAGTTVRESYGNLSHRRHELLFIVKMRIAEWTPTSETRSENKMVGDTGIEPVTPCMSSKYSNHLS